METILIFFMILLGHTSSVVQCTKNIFILAGQSNMVGEGGVIKGRWDGFIPPECEADPQILRLNRELAWEEAHEPLHQGIAVAGYCGVGPGMPFAHAVLAREEAEIGLVPCACEGTNITQWMRGSLLYNRTLTRAQAAISSTTGGAAIRAILWYQGESDTGTQSNAELYKARLEQFFTDLRSDLHLPLLPVIQVALASGESEGFEIVRKAQLETNLPNVTCVDAKGLELEEDPPMKFIHLTTPSQVQLGKMMADAYFKIIST